MFHSLLNLTFLNPWILAGLIFLPALWFLLRVIPPAPKRIRFPAVRFLMGLQAEEHTSSRTPWWILLLRLAIAALVIFALARPIFNPADSLPGRGPVRIVIDNGWEAAQTWNLQTAQASLLIASATREKREIYILTTAPEPGKEKPAQQGPLAGAVAGNALSALKPQPWPASYKQAVAVINEAPARKESIASFWLVSGLQNDDPVPLMNALRHQGELKIIRPEPANLPLLLRPVAYTGGTIEATVATSPTAIKGTPVTAQAFGSDGRILDTQKGAVAEPGESVHIRFDLPPSLRQQVAQIRLEGRTGVGAVVILDDTTARRAVGIAAAAGADENAPLIDDSYYLRRALEPYADIQTGAVASLLEKKPDVIILPDIGALPPDELTSLEKWVRGGGLLLRFAGPHMTQGETFLTPVSLLKGGRALDGGMTWEKPPHISPFPQNSPYYGLPIDADITVSRQILAVPEAGDGAMVWGSLEDGTPLITARTLDRGQLVMIHTTATPEWSDLALSGLFVQLLQRTVRMAGQSFSVKEATGTLQPVLVIDGMGRLIKPEGFVQPIPAEQFDKIPIDSTHPPGIYGRSGFQRTLNLGDRLSMLKPFTASPGGVSDGSYGGARETELMPWILAVSFALFLADWLVMIMLQAGFYTYSLRRDAATAIAVILLLWSPAARAETGQDMINYAGALHLAYVRTGISQIDITSQNGLTALARVLSQRTSVEPEGVVALDPATDDLAFFPLIYWPVTSPPQPLPPQAVRNVQFYLDHGGTILFDTRDKQSTPDGLPGASAGGVNGGALRTLTNGLNIPPLIRMPEDHVLSRSFYLMQGFPGRYDGGVLWIEENSATGRDGVSSVIIGNHDWAAAWAAADTGRPRLGGGPQQQEMALRFGVNLVMYALTGNYKADQVHLPFILERLGQ